MDRIDVDALNPADKIRLGQAMKFLGQSVDQSVDVERLHMMKTWKHSPPRYYRIRRCPGPPRTAHSMSFPVSSPVTGALAISLLFFSIGMYVARYGEKSIGPRQLEASS